MSLSTTDYEKIVHFINQTHYVSKNIQTLLSALFRFNHSLFWRADTQGNMYNLDFLNFDDKLIFDYTEIYNGKDVMHPKKQLLNVTNNQESVLIMEEITTPTDFSKSMYYEFVESHQIIDQMVLYLANGSIIYGGIGFVRFKGDNPFTQKDKEILRTLSIHLLYLEKNKMLLKEVKAENLFLKKDENDALGIIQLNKNQSISFYNEGAQNIIQTIDPSSTVKEYFQNSIMPNISQSFSDKESPYYFNLNKRKIKIITHDTDELNPMADKYTIYLYPDEKMTTETHLLSLLSNRELDIYHLVLRGFTNEEISKQLWISIHTVKKHLRNMYEKLGVSNRTSLIYKLESATN